MQTSYKKASCFSLFLILIFCFTANSVLAVDTCPGEPQTLYWLSSNTSGVCTPDSITPGGGSIPSCNFTVIPNSSNSSTIYPAASCTVTLTCDGLSASDSLTVNPNQSRCCGNWDLASAPTWNGSSCVASTGFITLSAPTCQIAIGASSCSVNATWSTSNPVGTSAITTDPSVTLYTANSGGPSPVSSTGVGSRTFYLYNNGSLLDQKTLTTTCAPGSSWVSGSCAATPPGNAPTVSINWLTNPINIGGTSNIVVSSTNATACYGVPGSIWVGDLGGTATGPGGVSSPVMNTAGNFPQGVYCTGPNGTSSTVTASLTVNAPGSCTGSVTWNNCSYPVTGLSSGSSISSSNTNSGYSGSATLSCSNGVLTGSNHTCNPVPATDQCGPASLGNGGGPSVAIPTGAAACTSGAYSPIADIYTFWAWNCGAGTCTTLKDLTPPPPPVLCNVPTDLYYGSTLVACAGYCANNGSPYPACPVPLGPDLIGGSGSLTQAITINGHPTYQIGASTYSRGIDVTAGEAVTINGTITNQGISNSTGPFNNYIRLTTQNMGPGGTTYERIGSVISTPALNASASRTISTTATVPLAPSLMDYAAFAPYPPGSKLYYLQMCADQNSPTDTTGTVTEIFEDNNCSFLTFLNVLASPTGSLISSSPTCTIATAANSCMTDLTWTSSNTIGAVEVTSNNPSATNPVFTGPNGGPFPASIRGVGATTFYLYNSAIELANTTVTTSCEGTNGGWDTVSGTCRDPEVVSATITGQYYPPGTLELTCNRSNSYSVTLNGVTITSGAYTVPITYNAITLPGSYVIRCMYGSVIAQVARPYDSFPPAAEVDLKIVPTTITEEDDVVITWDTQFPTNACTLSARVVCANNACTASQLLEATKLNTILNSTTTDFNDPGTSRLLQNAIKQVRPGGIDVDWRAIGKKTLNIRYTTDFTYDCNGVRSTRRVQVTKSEEQ